MSTTEISYSKNNDCVSPINIKEFKNAGYTFVFDGNCFTPLFFGVSGVIRGVVSLFSIK